MDNKPVETKVPTNNKIKIGKLSISKDAFGLILIAILVLAFIILLPTIYKLF